MMKRVLTSVMAAVLTTTAQIGPRHVFIAPAPATTAADLNTRTQNIAGLGNFDAGRLMPLADGRWLSFTGDATVTHDQQWPVYDNAAVIWDSAGQRRIESTQPGGHFFPRWEDGSEFWPLSFAVVGVRVYVLGTRVLSHDGGTFTPMGAYGAVVNVPEFSDPVFVRYFPTPSSLLGDEAVQWTGAIAADGDTVYVHGVLNHPEAFNARDGGFVARVPLSRLEVPHRWQFWTGSAWTDRNTDAVATIPLGQLYTTGSNGSTNSYTLHRRPNGGWQVTTKRGGDLSSELGRYVSATPYGPWTWETLATVCDLACYLPGAAPGVPTVSGNLLVQWSRAGSTPYWTEVSQ